MKFIKTKKSADIDTHFHSGETYKTRIRRNVYAIVIGFVRRPTLQTIIDDYSQAEGINHGYRYPRINARSIA